MRERIVRFVRHFLTYGIGDGATGLIALLLLPVFTRYLSPSDYGVLGLLLIVEQVARVVFRWGMEVSFMRLYVDAGDDGRRRLVSTLVYFLIGANGALLVPALFASPWIARALIHEPSVAALVALTLVGAFVSALLVVPFHTLRIQEQSARYVALTTVRLSASVAFRLGLVVLAGAGLTGMVVAELGAAVLTAAVAAPWLLRQVRLEFSRAVLSDALRIGLPRVPHGLAQIVIWLSSRYALRAHGTLAEVGLYTIGANFGLMIGLALATLEAAWTPFVLSIMHAPDARRTYSVLSTYIAAVLVLVVAGVSVLADDLVRLFAAPEFREAARVTPWLALAMLFQGVYLVGSIGLLITKRTRAYPIATGTAAVVVVTANAWLVPSFGMIGAAWAMALAYAVLAAVALAFARQAYPVPYEWGRLARIGLAGLVAFAAGTTLTAGGGSVAGLLLRGVATTAAYGAALWITGFLRPEELRELRGHAAFIRVRRD